MSRVLGARKTWRFCNLAGGWRRLKNAFWGIGPIFLNTPHLTMLSANEHTLDLWPCWGSFLGPTGVGFLWTWFLYVFFLLPCLPGFAIFFIHLA